MGIRTRKLTSGKIAYDVEVQYNKERVKRTVRGTLTQARRVEARILNELVAGKFDLLRQKQDPKFNAYAAAYAQSITWQKSYDRTLHSLARLKQHFDDQKLSEITVQNFINYRTSRLKSVKPATVNREYACLKRMLNLAVKSDDYVIHHNPLRDIKALEEQPAVDRTLSLDEYYQLLAVAPEYFRRIIFFACNTGMRKNEIVSLTFGQIKLRTLGIEIELVETKSGKREYVPLNGGCHELIQQIAGERRINLHKLPKKHLASYVFLHDTGRHFRDYRRSMEKSFTQADLALRPFHTFRHFWTSQMFAAGNDVARIKEIGRWGDLQTMLRYCHTSNAERFDAANNLGKHLEKRPAKLVPLRSGDAHIVRKQAINADFDDDDNIYKSNINK